MPLPRPRGDEGWSTALEALIGDPAARAAAEAKILEGFKPMRWRDAATRWLEILAQVRKYSRELCRDL